MTKILIETGTESHSSSWQKCQAKYFSGPQSGQFLYQHKPAITSQQTVARDNHQTVIATTYEILDGTLLHIDYKGFQGPESFVIRVDSAQEVQEREVGTSSLRTYTLKGRFTVERDLIKETEEKLKKEQTEGF